MEYGYMKASQELDRIMAKYGSNNNNYGLPMNDNNSISRISFNVNDNSLRSTTSIDIKSINSKHTTISSPSNNNNNKTNIRTTNITKSSPISIQSPDALNSQLGGTTAVTNIVAAFRELQTKLKIIEEERANAFRDREETKRQLEILKKDFAIRQSQLEINTTEQLLNTSASSEQLRTQLGESQAQESSLHHIHGSLQRTIQAHKGIINGLTDDISELNPKIWYLEEKQKTLSEQYKNVQSRISQLEAQPIQKSHSDMVELATIKSEIAAVEAYINDTYNATRRSNIRITALEKYANLMTTVNGDLCNTILAREKTKEKVIQFASLYTPPRYTWPKQLPYSEILSVINDAADSSSTHTGQIDNTRRRVVRKDSIPRRVNNSKSLSPQRHRVMSPQEGALIAATTLAAIAAQSSDSISSRARTQTPVQIRKDQPKKDFLPSSANPSNKQHNVQGIISHKDRNDKSFKNFLASRVLSIQAAASEEDQLFDNLNSNDIALVNNYIEQQLKTKSKKFRK
jgi:hypothetical protein